MLATIETLQDINGWCLSDRPPAQRNHAGPAPVVAMPDNGCRAVGVRLIETGAAFIKQDSTAHVAQGALSCLRDLELGS